MRFSLAVLALAASSVSASLIARQLPSCANDCLLGPTVDLDGCGPRENLCLCKSEKFVSKSTACIAQACKGDDLTTAINISQQICLSVGVTLTGTIPGPTSTAPEGTDATSAPQSTPTAPASTGSGAGSSSGTGSGTAPPPAQTSNAALSLAGNAAAGLAAALGIAVAAL
ncbi:hypothetical protein D9615_009506 [Tricholomella constricta]|uniref:CFEM domain-containing protein n=1 Tax=Tricholomella constricta TaxID=117010 RepID=A0A8H5LXX7_9AGAR|nr:hypothetical protein D9615_009506 [Tricholomella constricta]